MELHTHYDGDELIYALENPPPSPHIVFLDLNMPGKNGFETLKELRQTNDFKDLPIVILSTSTDESSIRTSRRLGANYYIPKSTDYTKLKTSVHYALNMDWERFVADPSNFVYQ